MPVPSLVPIFKGIQSSTADVAASNSYDFLGVDIGTAHPKRIVIVGSINPSGLTSNPTVNGVAITNRESDGSADGFNIGSIAVPTGTTADISVPIALGTALRCVVAVWIAYPASATPIGNDDGTATGTTNATADNVSIVPGGFLVAWGGQQSTVGSFTGSWSGADTPSEEVDATIEAATSYAAWTMPTTEALATGDFTLAASASGIKKILAVSWGVPAADVPIFMHQYRQRRV